MAPSNSEKVRKRIEEIVESMFAGSQRAMALKIGYSPGSMSRVLAGHASPSKKLLQAIAELPQVNTQWLLTGEGTLFQTQPQVLTDIGSIVPVARQLLRGSPLESEELLSPRFLSVPRAFFSATTYAIVVESCNCDRVLRTREFLKPDDTLIIETSPDRWGDVSRKDSQKLRVMHSAEYGAALAASESDYDRITRRFPQQKDKMNIPKTIDGRRPRAIKLDEDDDDNLDEPEKHVDFMRTRGRRESPVVAGLVTLQMREYLHS